APACHSHELSCASEKTSLTPWLGHGAAGTPGLYPNGAHPGGPVIAFSRLTDPQTTHPCIPCV
uniref:Uncharacterized protein n=1 Tax=Bos taurus TaxID=9913 RepID=A0ABI0P0D7_BOVIN